MFIEPQCKKVSEPVYGRDEYCAPTERESFACNASYKHCAATRLNPESEKRAQAPFPAMRLPSWAQASAGFSFLGGLLLAPFAFGGGGSSSVLVRRLMINCCENPTMLPTNQ